MKKKKDWSSRLDMTQYDAAKLQDIHGPFLRKFYRIAGIYIAEKINKHTSITPNQITLFSFFLALLASYFIYIGKYPYLIFSSFLIVLAHVLDYADGSLARIKGTSNTFGRWLDMFTDQFALVILFYAAIMSVFRDTGDYVVLIYGPLGLIASLIISLIYSTFLRLHSEGLDEIENEKKKSRFLTNFYYTEFLIFLLFALACLFNMINEFLIFCAVYGWIFLIVVFVKLSIKAYNLRRPG